MLEITARFEPAQLRLGIALGDNQQYQEAISVLKQVVRVDPNNPDAHNSLGYAYSQQGQFTEAISHYEIAIHLNGIFAQAHVNLGIILLKLGELSRGFAEYEWRWRIPGFSSFKYQQPRWDGREIVDRTLAVFTGKVAQNAIQFIRYLPSMRSRCQTIILVCPSDLIPLFKNVDGIDRLITEQNLNPAAFDFYVSLMSLPHLLGTTIETIPREIPYIKISLRDEDLKLPKTSQLRVGINCGDMTIDDFLPILEIPDIQFYNLQQGDCTLELTKLPSHIELKDLSSLVKNSVDLAKVIQQLNLVISVDSSMVHLAGALGKPVWTLLSDNPDWWWMVEGTNCFWYPTMRLCRKSPTESWHQVLKKVAEELALFFENETVLSG